MADASSAKRLAAEALAVSTTNRSRILVPLLVAIVLIVAGVVGVFRSTAGDPPIVIRGEGDTIVIERGSGKNRSTEVLRNDSPRGGVVVIREGGD